MTFQYNTVPSKMARRVIKYSGGLIKTEDQANRVLLVFAVVIFIIAAYLFYRGNVGTEQKLEPLPPGYKIVYPQDGSGLYQIVRDPDFKP